MAPCQRMPRQRIDPAELTAIAARIADADGLAELTLAKVADGLGVQSSALYNHVDGVDGLRRALSIGATKNLASCLRDAAVGRAGSDAINAVARQYRAFAREHPGQYAAALLCPPAEDPELEKARSAVIETFARIIEAMGVTGDDAIHAARAVRSAVHGFVDLEASDALIHPADRDESFEHVLELVARGLPS